MKLSRLPRRELLGIAQSYWPYVRKCDDGQVLRSIAPCFGISVDARLRTIRVQMPPRIHPSPGLSVPARPIGRLRHNGSGHALSMHALEAPHATTGKRKASRVLLIPGPSAPLHVVYALKLAHSRLSVSRLPLPRACDTDSCGFDTSDPFGFFSLNRTCRCKQHGAPPKTGGRVCKPEDV